MRKHHESRDKEIAIDHDGQEGMTLRDYFAGKALQGLCANPEFAKEGIDTVARWSFNQADAMLEERAKS
jgi:hypothetical protein